ncbi:hypothetical protein CesoFtcFv8_001093 [Champsocephalus esox]|uniref:Uncharacterized protein n=1 Tax=Champsocephalus esox TaxID=159716 RepID=A0AAN8D571_9TELE|nr:hypothetical protein CesoFtcFv8_001093 [Champsocephalus esox]
MSNSDDSEDELFQEDLNPSPDAPPEAASPSSSYRRPSTRAGSRSSSHSAEADLLTLQLQQKGKEGGKEVAPPSSSSVQKVNFLPGSHHR